MKQKFLLAALIAVVAIGFGVREAQAADAQQSWAELDAKTRPLMDQMYQKRSELAGIYASGNVDQARVEALYRDMAELQAQMFQIRQQYEGSANYAGNGGWYGPGMGGGCFGGGCGGYAMGGGWGRGGRGGWGGGRGGWGRGGMGGGRCW